MRCPPFEMQVDLIDGRLAPAAVESTESHLAGCGSCAEAAGWYRAFVATAASDASIDPPAWVTRRAISLFAEAREEARRRGVRGLLARLRGALVFDSYAGALRPDAVSVRNDASEPQRQLLFSAPPFDVDIVVSAGEGADRLRIVGQVLSEVEETFESVGSLRVELASADGTSAETTTSDFGEFSFDDVAPGLYELRLAGEHREIVLPEAPLELR